METGTLKELNVKPGDVVECVWRGDDMYGYKVGDEYTVSEGGWVYGMIPGKCNGKFRIISRAAQPTPDLTAITTPFGLLDADTQEALRAHGGPYEYWYDGDWFDTNNTDYPTLVHRVKAGPVTVYVSLDAFIHPSGIISKIESDTPQPVRITFNRVDGLVDLGSYRLVPR